MTIRVEIYYDAKCKHCANRSTKKNGKRNQSFCEIKKEFIAMKDKACQDFKL